MRFPLRAHLALLCAGLIYGANYLIVKDTFREISPAAMIAIRSLGVALTLELIRVFFIREDIHSKKDWVVLGFCALLGIGINQICFLMGLSLTTPGNASILMVTCPVFVFMISHLTGKENITPARWAGLALAGTGTLFFTGGYDFSFSNRTLNGDMLILLNSLSYGIYLVYIRPFMLRYNPLTVMSRVFLLGALINVPFGFREMVSVPYAGISLSAWGGILYLTFANTLIAYSLTAYAMRSVFSTVAGIYVYLQPVVAVSLSFLIHKEILSVSQIISALLVFTGVYFTVFHGTDSAVNSGKGKGPRGLKSGGPSS